MATPNKLSLTDMTKIRVMREHGATLKAIADEFGVTPPAVLYALRRMGRRA